MKIGSRESSTKCTKMSANRRVHVDVGGSGANTRVVAFEGQLASSHVPFLSRLKGTDLFSG